MSNAYLAFDLGAESGRGVLATFESGRLSLAEVGRFQTTPDSKEPGADGTWRWDFEQIVAHMRQILAEAEQRQPLAGVAVDTWGVDYGLVDAAGVLLEAPVCYRDLSHAVAMSETLTRIPAEELWAQSGIQLLPFNTIFQLIAAHKRNPGLLERADRLLFMPDLLASRLCATPFAASELTIASTSAMLDPYAKSWNLPLIERVGIPTHLLSPIVEPGAAYGTTAGGTPVWAAAGHDTACAIAAIPGRTGDTWAYISSGTWSLVGVERPGPLVTLEALKMGLSNEIGVGRQTRLLKNVMGLWLVQECRRTLERIDRPYSYEQLTMLAEAAADEGPLVDATDHRFISPVDMLAEIRTACVEGSQNAPTDVGSLTRCCLDSLALAYRRTLADLEHALHVKFSALHIVGGGTKNRLLNQLAANACGIPVIAGPAEATAAGNVLAQMVGRGELAGWNEAREVSLASFDPEVFTPDSSLLDSWAERDAAFKASAAR